MNSQRAVTFSFSEDAPYELFCQLAEARGVSVADLARECVNFAFQAMSWRREPKAGLAHYLQLYLNQLDPKRPWDDEVRALADAAMVIDHSGYPISIPTPPRVMKGTENDH